MELVGTAGRWAGAGTGRLTPSLRAAGPSSDQWVELEDLALHAEQEPSQEQAGPRPSAAEDFGVADRQ